MTDPVIEPPPHPQDAYLLRLHGAGDGSVMPYCRHCADPIGILPRPATLDVVNQAWVLHLEAVGAGEPLPDYRCRLPHPLRPSPACQTCREHGHVRPGDDRG